MLQLVYLHVDEEITQTLETMLEEYSEVPGCSSHAYLACVVSGALYMLIGVLGYVVLSLRSKDFSPLADGHLRDTDHPNRVRHRLLPTSQQPRCCETVKTDR